MIRIGMDIDGMRVEIDGHAGYAQPGQDIVCAAVSVLTYTLAENLRLTLYPDEYDVELSNGHARIQARPPKDRAERCRDIYMTIANGYCMLAAQYDQYVQIEQAEE